MEMKSIHSSTASLSVRQDVPPIAVPQNNFSSQKSKSTQKRCNHEAAAGSQGLGIGHSMYVYN